MNTENIFNPNIQIKTLMTKGSSALVDIHSCHNRVGQSRVISLSRLARPSSKYWAVGPARPVQYFNKETTKNVIK